jgi:alkyl hydroperoxide reductase subunit D
MSVELLAKQIPDYAKDIRLNLSNVLSESGSVGLSLNQIAVISLGVAYTLSHQQLGESILNEFHLNLTEADIQAAKSASAIMAMNNIYYRFVHLTEDKTFSTMPAKLRMNVISNPGIAKNDYELICLAISAINGCGLCIDSHTKILLKHGMSYEGIQSSVRIAAVLNAVAATLTI